MRNQLEEMKKSAQGFLDGQKVAEAKSEMEKIKDMKDAIAIQEQLDIEEEENIISTGEKENKNKSKEKSASVLRAMIKNMCGRRLTEAENALLLPSTSSPNGENGESYILPQDISTVIHKKVRQYKSLRDVLGYYPATTLTGSVPVETYDTLTELIDFSDGTEGTMDKDIKFGNVSFSLKEKAAFVPLSNTLLKLTDNNLIEYVSDIFAKKAVITENKMAINILKSNKIAKALKGWEDLKSSINKDLDPASLYDMKIATNQDGFDYLDNAKDGMGRPILQEDPTQKTKKLFKGYPIEVYSNDMLKSADGKIPVIYGDLKNGVKVVDLNGQIDFAVDKSAGFMKNVTMARVIEFVDVVQVDKSDKCYIYGEFTEESGV